LAGAETIVDIARFGEKKLELLRRFRPFVDGTPSHDHLGDILVTLDTEPFERCFVAGVAALTGVPRDVVAIDGKTLRRSAFRTGRPSAADGARGRGTAIGCARRMRIASTGARRVQPLFPR
jgi:hypothetical protein